jgi:hypothetical protein
MESIAGGGAGRNRTRSSGILGAPAVRGILSLLLLGCTRPPLGEEALEAPVWPYAGILPLDRVPPGLSLFAGRWIEATPDGSFLVTETGDPRYLVRFAADSPLLLEFYDLGAGAEVETLAFLDELRSVFLVSAVRSPEQYDAVVARAFLHVDLEQGILVDTLPLSRHARSRGFAVDPVRQRGFLFVDVGEGSGRIEARDLYSGAPAGIVETGIVPAGVERRGLAIDRNHRWLFCLAGGEAALSDFEPIGEETPTGPALLFIDVQALRVTARVPLDEGFEPRAVGYDPVRDTAYVLATSLERSRIFAVDVSYPGIRSRVEIPEVASDLVVTREFAFCPGPNGIYVIDLGIPALTRAPSLPFELPGEMAVTGGPGVGFVLFHAASTGEDPGIAVVTLATGTLLRVLR